MAAPKLSSQDKKDLDKFTKYLVYKCIQVIVQSRLGEKVRTQSKAFSSGSDWFNLALKDIPEVFAETKKVFPSSTLAIGQTVCVEMSLRTPESETMVLETWKISMQESCDPSARVSYTVYNRMGILLKSLVCISRATPTYRLSRRQGPETFIICYRLYMGEPQTQNLGEGYQTVKVGSVPTPLGTASLGLMYRTKLLISPQPCSSHDLAINLKDNHFTQEGNNGCQGNNPKWPTTPKPCQNFSRETKTTPQQEDASSNESEFCTTTFFTQTGTSPSDACSPHLKTPSPRSPHRKTVDEAHATHLGHSSHRNKTAEGAHTQQGLRCHIPLPRYSPHHKTPEEADPRRIHSPERVNSFPSLPRVGAFAQLPETCAHLDTLSDYDDVPFLALIEPQGDPAPPEGGTSSSKEEESGVSDASMETQDRVSLKSAGSGSGHSSCSRASAPEDFVMVELKTPFAVQDSNSDLGRFYRDFQGAPALSMFNQPSSVEDTLNAITDQLALFEACSKDFDDFVESLPITEDN